MIKINKRKKIVKKEKKFINADKYSLNIANNQRNIVGGFLSALLFISAIAIGVESLQMNDFPGSPVMANSSINQIPSDPPMGGKTEGVGTYFEIINSQYLNVAIKTTDAVYLSIESIPEIVTMNIEAESSDIMSTSVTLTGFLPLTTYHKYQDDYTNHEVFITDDSGNYTYTQDLTVPHFVYIQPRPSTKVISDVSGGDCTSVGDWDESVKTCTLSQDVNESIQINGNNITLDGNGHNLIGVNTGFGVS